jgi:1,3-beta-glucan synthase
MLTTPSVWLRPSKQIRAPLYSMKVKKQRQWIVIKYGIVYLCISGAIVALVVFVGFFYSLSQVVP